MTIDPRRECVVCAWRENCAKKFKSEKGVAHCADFVRDETLPPEEQETAHGPAHKKIEDPFAD